MCLTLFQSNNSARLFLQVCTLGQTFGVALYASSAWSAVSWVQSAGASSSGATSVRVKLGTPTRSGNALVACVGSGVPVESLTDNLGSTYTLLGQAVNSSGAGTVRVYFARPRRSAPVTVTMKHAWGHADLAVSEYQGLLRRKGFQAQDAGFNTGAIWSSGNLPTVSPPGDLLIGCAFEVYSAALPSVSFTPGAGFAPRWQQRGLFVEDFAVKVGGAYSATGLRAPADNLNVVAAVASFSTKTSGPEPSIIPSPTPRPSTIPTATPRPVVTPTPTPAPTPTLTPVPSAVPSIPPSGTQDPIILFTDVTSGPNQAGPNNLGTPIAIFGKHFGSERGSSRVTIGGSEVAAYALWGTRNAHNPDLDMLIVQPGPGITGGPIVVTVNGRASNADHTFNSNNGSLYYVAPNGLDNPGCSAQAPCSSISQVVTERMQPGDTLLLRGGVYTEAEVWIRSILGHSGLPGQQKVIKNYPGEEVVLENATRPFIVDADYITVSGLNFRNGKSLGIPDTGLPGHRGNRFLNNTFVGTIDWGAIDTHGDQHLLAGNVCDVNGSTVGTQGHCYYVSYGRGIDLLYNIASGAPGYGIHVFDQLRSTNDFQRIIRDVRIEGNLLKNSTQRSGLIIAMADEGGLGNLIDNVIIKNNTFTANSHLGLLITGISRNITVTGNHFVENGRQGIHVADDAGVIGVSITDNDIIQTNGINCRNDCSWYNLAHIQVGFHATDVSIAGNRYSPMPPMIINGTDNTARDGSAAPSGNP